MNYVDDDEDDIDDGNNNNDDKDDAILSLILISSLFNGTRKIIAWKFITLLGSFMNIKLSLNKILNIFHNIYKIYKTNRQQRVITASPQIIINTLPNYKQCFWCYQHFFSLHLFIITMKIMVS